MAEDAEDGGTERARPFAIPPDFAASIVGLSDSIDAITRQASVSVFPEMQLLSEQMAKVVASSVIAPTVDQQRALAASMASVISDDLVGSVHEIIASTIALPTASDFLFGSAKPATPTEHEEEALAPTVDALVEAGVTPPDLDRLAVAVVVLRLMAMAGAVGGGLALPPYGILASLKALQEFLAELVRLRDLLARREGD